MKKILLSFLLAMLGYVGAQAQIVYEDFEGGTSDLPWTAADGTYNGVIANPGPDAVNGSAFVGSYTKGAGFGYSLFWVPNLAQPLDLSEYNQFKLKVWCSTATDILLKFEGPGQAVEKKATMTKANAWNELSFDMSAGVSKDKLVKIIIFFDPGVDASSNTYYFDDLIAYKAERCYEDFEGPGLTWQALDGSFTGNVDNPKPNSVNASAKCGQYVKSNTHAYSLLLADYGTPMDLSVFNQFKLQVYATANTQVLLKLEGPGGNIEKTKNIAIANTWQEYTFDFSAAANNTGLTKVILFFDPGVETSGDTYYFDNLCAVPNNCAGVTPDPELIEDFECNRNGIYDNGWDSLAVVKNPAPDGTNASPKAGLFHPVVGSAYSALVYDYQNPIDLTARNRFSLKVWSPKKGNLLLKIEGGGGGREIAVPMTETNKWVEYTVDFSDQAGKGRTRLVIFFNAGVDAQAGDYYYFDDVKLAAPPTLPPLENFEGGLHLGWQPLDGNNTLHGVFTGPTNNPSPGGANTSAQVGCYAKGTSAFSTLQAFAPAAFDLSVYPQFNLDVLSPATGGKVKMQLSSATAGNKEVEVPITKPGEWETLNFDFSPHSGIKDFGEIRLIFNAGTAALGQSWCVDNLNQSKATTDPCKDVVPVPNIVDDYECQRNYVDIFYGKDDVKAVNNPFPQAGNGSLKVGEYKDPANAPWAGIGFQFAQAVDLSLYNQLKVKVYSPQAGIPFLFKLQGGQQVEIWDTIPEANKWYQFSIDFSSAKDKGNTQLVIFFNASVDGPGATYYIDDVRWSRADYSGCLSDYESPFSTFGTFQYFNNGTYNKPFEVVANPKPAGINTSAKVGKFVEAADATIYFGMFQDLEAFMNFKGTKQVKMKVLMDHIGKVTAKTEIFGNMPPPTEVTVENTKVNEWEELTFNFSNAPDDPSYNRFTIFFDITSVGTGTEVVSYFDDIVLGAGACGSSSVFDPSPLQPILVAPNPVANLLRVENFDGIARLDVYNTLGQRVASLNTSGDSRTEIDVTRFPAGMYSLTGFTQQGQPVGFAKFVKQ